jgi:serine/threonine-protein kinase HipA
MSAIWPRPSSRPSARREWSLSPAYDLNPASTDLKAPVLTTNIDLDEGTCSLDLPEAASEFFGLTLQRARAIIKRSRP